MTTMSTGSALILTNIILSLCGITFVTLFAVSLSTITATPLWLSFPPEYITLTPSLTKSPPSFHRTSLNPNTFKPNLVISNFTFSNFPFLSIVRTFHAPTLTVGGVEHRDEAFRFEPPFLRVSSDPTLPSGFGMEPSSKLWTLVPCTLHPKQLLQAAASPST